VSNKICGKILSDGQKACKCAKNLINDRKNLQFLLKKIVLLLKIFMGFDGIKI
jgi:hypothetical protein